MQKWSEERVICEIRELAAQNSGAASSGEKRNLQNAAVKFFGSWSAACEAAGVNTVRKSKRFEAREDCRFHKDKHTCSALKQMYCTKEKCKFWKPKLKWGESVEQCEQEKSRPGGDEAAEDGRGGVFASV